MSKAILKFEVHEAGDGSSEFKIIEIVTDRTPEWTMSQYLRNRVNTTMKHLYSVPFAESEEKSNG
jgi:hypothetical protein|tara:strand:- start:308 stop:502 length:195 start_codon:yes stop_codon:yes gene_type:complete